MVLISLDFESVLGLSVTLKYKIFKALQNLYFEAFICTGGTWPGIFYYAGLASYEGNST